MWNHCDRPVDDLPDLVNRREDYAALTNRIRHRDDQAIHLYGPKGTGKTLLTRHALQELPQPISACCLSCISHDTQYKVLTALCTAVGSGDFSTGYHTAQLYHAFEKALTGQEVVIVLDDVDFLLLNDGNDLLYTLSRLKQAPRLVLVSATYPDLATELDERTYSSLLPYTINVEPYTEAEAAEVLERRARDWLDQDVTTEAVADVAAATTNIQVGYHWLTVAAEITEGPLTAEIIRLVRDDAVRRYQAAQLAVFTIHHRLLLDAVHLLTADTTPVRSGPVYDWYRELCTQTDTTPLSTRRLSDFLKQLDLLGLIRTEYQYGGDAGKTRHIWSQEL